MPNPVRPRDVLDVFRVAGKELYYHQLDFVSDLLFEDNVKVLLADDVGLGKTVQTVAYLSLALRTGLVRKALVIVPTVVLPQWLDEMQVFDILNNDIYVIMTPDYRPGYSVYIVTMDRAKKDEYLSLLERLNWDLVVVDEAHKIRYKTLRLRLAHLIRNAKRALLLTATPHTGDERDYYFLRSLVTRIIRREKRDLEEYEDKRVLPRLDYWVVRVLASPMETRALRRILKRLKTLDVEPIVRFTVLRRALSSPLSFITTLRKVLGRIDVVSEGNCTDEEVEEDELDICLARAAGILSDVIKFTDVDRKLEVLTTLLNRDLKDRKPVIFTEYATTAEYLFEKLLQKLNCTIRRRGEGYGVAICDDRSIMFVTAKARNELEINKEVEAFSMGERAILISTDVFSEGVNLQEFDSVVNYETVWSPTKHIQRIGRVWRFGQRAEKVLVVDLVLDVPRGEAGLSEFDMYTQYLEKLYRISLHGLTPQTYTEEYAVITIGENDLVNLLSLSGVRITNTEVFKAIYDFVHGTEGRLAKLLDKLRKLMELRNRVRSAKEPEEIRRDVWLKLGYRRDNLEKTPSPGSDYVLAEITVSIGNTEIFKEDVLVHVPGGWRERRSAIFREVELEGANIKEVPGNVSMDVEGRTRKVLAQKYLENLRIYLEKRLKTNAKVAVRMIRPVMVESVEVLDDFARAVKAEIRRSHRRKETEIVAVKCIINYLKRHGYTVVEPYFEGPRPFDMVIRKENILYTVECKGRHIRTGESLSITLTSNEVDWGLRFPDRHIICVAVVDNNMCTNVECSTFREFKKRWDLKIEKSYYDYVIIATKRNWRL